MATIILDYDASNPIARKTIGYIRSLGIFEMRNGLDQAMDELKAGKTVTCKDFDDYLEKVK